MLRATQSFAVFVDGTPRHVREGDLIADEDVLAQTHAALLEPARPTERSREIHFGVVEQATAAPGERRNLPRKPRS